MTHAPHDSNSATVFKVETPKTPPSNKIRAAKWLVLFVVIGGTLFVSAAGATYAYTRDRILPNVTIAGMKVNGLDRIAATELLQSQFNTMVDAGVEVTLFDETKHLDLRTNVATDPDLVYQLIDWDVNMSVDEALKVGRTGNQLRDFFAPLYHLTLAPTHLTPHYVLAETRLSSALRDLYPNVESIGTPTDFVFVGSGENMSVTVTEAVAGAIIDTDQALTDLMHDAENLGLEALELRLIERSAIINKTEAEVLIPAAIAAIEHAPYELTFTPEYGDDLTYPITANDLKIWLVPSKNANGEAILTVDPESMESFLTEVHADIDIAPQDAKFVVEGDRVIEFSESHDGFIINDDQVLDDVTAALGTDNTSIVISAERTAPAVPTASANDLGIKEVLGVGFSSYAGSPANRRANIKHGADKLNGVLIAPGDTLSLLERLRPFTVADGYLPELVIKGDEIIPEVGGGLCQIGTTTFRAAMNSGLEIAERRNHSLVVSYYNDPSNGQPGTDATIYDPSPDLKITNDTGHYIMLITTVDAAKSQLTFTFWGTSDGRQGSYTPPKVLSWTGYGAPVEKETTSLKPGVRQCQAPHPGATTTFDYNIIQPDGTTKTREFFSSYRSLPSICLVGVGSTSAPPAAEVQGVSDEPISD
ncbi:MAG: binding 4 protein [Patescibacteria group bacterium]|nr:binding 4 protein [Patescibacteria group bacterium]